MGNGDHDWLFNAMPIAALLAAFRATTLAGPISRHLEGQGDFWPVGRIEGEVHRHSISPFYCCFFAEPCRGCGAPKNSRITARPSGVFFAHSSASQSVESNSPSIAR